MKNHFRFSFCLLLILLCNSFLVETANAQCDFIPAVAASNTGEWGDKISFSKLGQAQVSII